MNAKEFETLLVEYGNAMFDCGEFELGSMPLDESHEHYCDLSDKAQALKKRLIEAYQATLTTT